MESARMFCGIVVCCLMVNTILAQCVAGGPNSGSSFSSSSAIGTLAWSSPGNAISSNNSYANAGQLLGVFSSVNTQYLIATGFSFSVPTTATVCGIVVEVEKSLSGVALGSSVKDNSVKIVKGGSVTGVEHANAAAWSTTDNYITYGTSTDNWGAGWLPADVNASNFGVAVSATLASGIAGLFLTAQVDHIRITVYYDNSSALASAFTAFSVEKTAEGNQLHWTNLQNEAGSRFLVEWSGNGSSWQKIDSLDVTPGVYVYSLTDAVLRSGNDYYRILQVNPEGITAYSQVQMIRNGETTMLSLFPNPVKQLLTIRSAEPILRLSITGIDGKSVYHSFPLHQTGMQVNLSGYPSGIYFVQVNGKTYKLVKE